ncbi:MAG: hypothetical protein J6K03_06460 [Oscillospiraceae bacterium]|nr:hypothetical protein [Oscillospiraceae bacterium]
MKRIALCLLCILLMGAFVAGCRSNVPQETDGSIVPTDTQTPSSEATRQTEFSEPIMQSGTADTGSAQILQKIWDSYAEEERFAVYGGSVEMSVSDGPGDLDMNATEELTTRYLLPQEQLNMVTEGASLVHLMNNNIFTAVVFRLTDGQQAKALADAWVAAIRDNRWICGQPDRLLLAQPDKDHILMAFGSQDAMTAFQGKLTAAYPDSQMLYQEAIVA